MNYVIFDVETTTSNKGSPFDLTNAFVCSGLKSGYSNNVDIRYDIQESDILEIDQLFRSKVLVVGFNLKFDLNWHRRLGGVYPQFIWDCQLAEFLLSNQKERYPSLDGALAKYGYPPKLNIVATEYWDKGIDTTEVPREILTEYLERDLKATEEVFKRQWHMFKSAQYKHLYPLFKIQCQDLIVLADMEYNGVVFNTKEARLRANEISTQQTEIQRTVTELIGNVPYSLTSDAHLSAILYGGTILEEFRIPIGVYKTGEKAGQTRYSVNYKAYEFPRLVEPLKNSQVKDKVSKKEEEFVKKGILKEPRIQYAVNEDTFKLLKAKGKGKQLMELIMEFNKLDKLRSTYLEGWSNLIDEMNWEPDMLHSQLNQCLVVTGRLSSSKPNGQNADKATKKYCESRYV